MQTLTAMAARKKEVAMARTGWVPGAHSLGGSTLGSPSQHSFCNTLMPVTASPLHWQKWSAFPARQQPGSAELQCQVTFHALLITFLAARTPEFKAFVLKFLGIDGEKLFETRLTNRE
ncbi:hypothetical protein [Polaromonas sp.]|uniref:hypothetical protein n=1 Tax=Polaromonas sp. TaxID=1869339 RepID=UPI0035672868